MFFEIAVNVVYAALAGWLTQRRLAFVVAAGAVGLIVALIVYGSLDVGMTRRTLGGGAMRVLFSFAMGVMIYRLRSLAPGTPIKAPWALEGLLLSLAAIFLMPASGLFDLVCILIVFPVSIMIGTRIEPALAPRFSALLGYLSYPVYVLHTPLVLIAAGAWKAIVKDEPNASMPVTGIMFAVMVLLASYALTRLYDVPLRAWLAAQRRGGRQSPAQSRPRSAGTTPSTAAS